MAEAQTLKEFSLDEVAKHKTAEDCWMIIKEDGMRLVYDVTQFLDDHPGGPEIMIDLAGQDATEEFEDIGHSNDARDQLKTLLIGKIEGDVKKEKKAAAPRLPGGASGSSDKNSGSSTGLVIIGALAVAAAAFFLQFNQAK
ncbi:hypothetical protein Poli38472_009644 [Pythium oligandrum]|uniref:Cytochrome b5 heme-binding domain-containing protein n=1 Tax=Pythium oligandrum TaxID=41045 RepID=A0A8K1CEW0_PYTOL|nr:hypothetical protein Poli38472_009644 [Pythium oligandrum]|eukprot:TMW62151.1 hypothetical protein Poli38472_009644 [Pythium oligandrum]